jgi:hypothetical protein
VPQSLAAKLKPETRFLLEEVCASSPPRAARPADAGAVLLEARTQQVRGLLERWAHANSRDPLGGALLTRLGERDPRYALQLVAETARLADAFDKAAVPVLVLKGAALSRRYYGDYGLREAGDIDLMIPDSCAERADRLVRENGYRRTKPRGELSPARLGLYLRTQHEFGYEDAQRPISVELHWRYVDCPTLQPAAFSELHSRGESMRVGTGEIRLLSPGDTFLQLAVHGAMDGWCRLKWIADLPRVRAEVSPAEMERLTDTAPRAGLGRVLDLALALAGDTPAQPGPWLETALDYVAWRLQNPHPRELSTGARLRHSLASRHYMRALFEPKFLRHIGFTDLIMPTDFDRVRLPDALTAALPYVARLHRGMRLLLGGTR